MTEVPKQKISGLAIVYNEEKHIAGLVDSLRFVDDITIVDSFSTDNTIEILKQYPEIKIVQNKFENFTAQRNLALENAKHDWVLFLDADERIPKALQHEIVQTVNSSHPKDAYYFYRKFMFKQRPLHFSGWQTDKNFRLFKKTKARYISERLVHETLDVNGSTGSLKNKLIHYSYDNFHSYKRKMLSYGKLRAIELYAKNVRPNFYHFYIKPSYKFFYDYFVRMGILDGRKGVIICYLNAYSVYARYQELKKLHRSQNNV